MQDSSLPTHHAQCPWGPSCSVHTQPILIFSSTSIIGKSFKILYINQPPLQVPGALSYGILADRIDMPKPQVQGWRCGNSPGVAVKIMSESFQTWLATIGR